MDLLAPARLPLRVASCFEVVASAATIAPLALIGMLAHELLKESADSGRAWTIVGAVVVALFLRTVMTTIALGISHRADIVVAQHLRQRIADTLARLPLGWFSQTPAGQVRKLSQEDVQELHYLVAHARLEIVSGVATPVIGVLWCTVLDWRLGIVATVPIAVYAASYAALMRGSTSKMAELGEAMARISATIVEFVSGISVVKTYGQVGRAHARFQSAADDFSGFYQSWVGKMFRTSALTAVLLSAPVVLIFSIGMGTWFASAGWVRPVDAFTATLVCMVIPTTVVTLGFGMQNRRQAVAAAGNLQAFFDTPSLPESSDPKRPRGARVDFTDVTFSYDGESDVLHGVNLSLPEGSVTALVGPSGSGKSTLATLLPRFADTRTGSVSIGGVDVRDIASDELYRQVGFVLQHPGILRISLRDNIRLSRPEASDEVVRAAARAAQIDDRIMDLPAGYDSVYGEDVQLSGGERQRIAIARAIVADAPVLVLDEATAFADPDSEAAVQKALSSLMVGKTVLVIAHRLSSITTVDNIAVLVQGRLVEQGTHDELLAGTGTYASLWQRHREGVQH